MKLLLLSLGFVTVVAQAQNVCPELAGYWHLTTSLTYKHNEMATQCHLRIEEDGSVGAQNHLAGTMRDESWCMDVPPVTPPATIEEAEAIPAWYRVQGWLEYRGPCRWHSELVTGRGIPYLLGGVMDLGGNELMGVSITAIEVDEELVACTPELCGEDGTFPIKVSATRHPEPLTDL